MVNKYYSLYDRMLAEKSLIEGFKRVKSAKGAPGIDGQSVNDFAENLELNIAILVKELKEKTYQPQPVKRVEIEKAGGGKRLLGVPAVRDRVVQQVLLKILQPIYDPEFHPSSYGYRPGRSCHQAIAKATMFIRKYDMKWVVDMDLSKCFDELDHLIIMDSFKDKIADGSILKLLEMFLKSGIMIGVHFENSTKGSPQGGVISPFIANVYLDNFDQEMMRRGHRIVRYADDILIFTRSEKAANNAMTKARKILEKRLKLRVNEEKSHIVHSMKGVGFLGVKIFCKYTLIQEKKWKMFKERVKKMTRRNSPVNLEKVIKELNPVLRGFGNYFKVTNSKKKFKNFAGWIRRRLRAKQLKLWKKPAKLHRRLRQLGYSGEFFKIKMNSWRNSASPLASYALPNNYFYELGLFDFEQLVFGANPVPE